MYHYVLKATRQYYIQSTPTTRKMDEAPAPIGGEKDFVYRRGSGTISRMV